MTIWIFNQYVHLPDVPGGTRHYDVACELVRRGHRVTIFASSFHHYMHQETRLEERERWRVEEVHGVTFVWIRTSPYQRNDWHRVQNMVSFMLRSWWLGKKIQKFTPKPGKPDVIIGSSVHLLAVLAAYWVAKQYRAKFIMEVRDLWPQTLIDMGEMSERNPIVKALQILERFLYRRAERIIVLAPRMGEYISARGIGKEKIVWIPNGIALGRFNDVEIAELPSERFKVMYLGAHGQVNALDVLLEAAKVLQNQRHQAIELILIGDGPEKPKLVELAKKRGLKNVAFRSPVRKSNVAQVLEETDATVLVLNDLALYKYGISPNKLFDYLAAGKPLILAGDLVDNPVKQAHCGLTVPPQNPEALAEAIVSLSRMPKEERETMGRRGREYVEKNYAIPVLVDKLIQCIEEVL